MPDLRFLIDFHWAISCLDGGWSSCRFRDDKLANDKCCVWRFRRDSSVVESLLVAVDVEGDKAAIGSSCMQKPSSSASSESCSAAAVATASASPPPPPSSSTDSEYLLLAFANALSSDNTNRLEFLRCCSITGPNRLVVRTLTIYVQYNNILSYSVIKLYRNGYSIGGRCAAYDSGG